MLCSLLELPKSGLSGIVTVEMSTSDVRVVILLKSVPKGLDIRLMRSPDHREILFSRVVRLVP